MEISTDRQKDQEPRVRHGICLTGSWVQIEIGTKNKKIILNQVLDIVPTTVCLGIHDVRNKYTAKWPGIAW